MYFPLCTLLRQLSMASVCVYCFLFSMYTYTFPRPASFFDQSLYLCASFFLKLIYPLHSVCLRDSLLTSLMCSLYIYSHVSSFLFVNSFFPHHCFAVRNVSFFPCTQSCCGFRLGTSGLERTFDSHQREEQDPLGVAMPFTCIRCTFSVPSLLAFPDSSLFLIHYLSSSFSFPLFRTALFYYKQRGEQKPPQTAIAIFLFLLLLCVIYLIAVSGPSPCGLIRERE
jgi:hypothetical protein